MYKGIYYGMVMFILHGKTNSEEPFDALVKEISKKWGKMCSKVQRLAVIYYNVLIHFKHLLWLLRHLTNKIPISLTDRMCVHYCTCIMYMKWVSTVHLYSIHIVQAHTGDHRIMGGTLQPNPMHVHSEVTLSPMGLTPRKRYIGLQP